VADSWTTANNLLNLGALDLVQNGTGYDSDLTDQYLMSAGGGLLNSGATAVSNAGRVEVNRVEVQVTATEGFVVGGSLSFNTNVNCGGGTTIAGTTTNITAANANSPVTVTVPTAGITAGNFGVTGTNPVYICYAAAVGSVAIPTSAFSAVGRVVKSKKTTTPWEGEQDNVCGGPLYALSGGIKIDVRNYANSQDPDGWYSVIRLINTSETGTARVYGQIIEQDGQFGPWGQIATLAPRAVVNMTSVQIDALLVNAPAAAVNADNGSSAPQDYDASGAPRLRITAEGVDTLRVQNYMVNPVTQAIAEFSSSQGVDFNADPQRALGNAQLIDQDARTGLNGQQ
jgi:hypothetical protein